MADLIDRQALIEWLKKVGRFMKCCEDTKQTRKTIGGIISHIEKLPTVDAEPVKWISVKNELPPTNEYVWCHSNKNGGHMFIGYRGYLTGDWMERGALHIGDVTHWMPLPEPPN